MGLILCGTGCAPQPTPTPTLTPPLPESSPTPSATATPAEPTAAVVNGEGIPLREYQIQLAQYQKAYEKLGKTPPSESDQSKAVLDDLISQTLLAQAALKNGFTLDDAGLQARLDALNQEMGGGSALADWENAVGYTDETFRVCLRRSIAAAWQRDQLLAAMPDTAEMVHVRQILVYNQADADAVKSQLDSGSDFATLASEMDPVTGGDLGWFPKGYLMVSEVEDKAFSMQPGEVSDIIHSAAGYHILQLVEKDENHALPPEVKQALSRTTLTNWVRDQRNQSQITVTLPSL